jgi:carboxymethylenebutenolidase
MMRVSNPEGTLELPAGGSGPGVLVVHAWWGLNDFFKALCKRLAQEGFVAFAPDLYGGKIAGTIEEAKRLRSTLKSKQAGQALVDAVEYLQGQKAVSGAGLGLVGFSLGAYFGLGLSRDRPRDVRAVVIFYGTRGGDYTKAKAAYLGHFAEADDWEPAAGVHALEKALREAGRPVSFHTYPGTGHWFFESDRPDAYDAAAAKLAWRRTTKFLHDTLIQ